MFYYEKSIARDGTYNYRSPKNYHQDYADVGRDASLMRSRLIIDEYGRFVRPRLRIEHGIHWVTQCAKVCAVKVSYESDFFY